jgi:peptidyl-prolyl cis-trans isomerase D
MLDMIRKKQKSVIIQIIFWTIIAAFVGTIFLVWGKGKTGGSEDGQMAVTVDDTRIDLASYQRTYQNMTDFYHEVYGAQFTPEMEKRLQLKRQALQTLIDQALILEEGKQLGIRVSKDELVASIAHIPAFQVAGQFDKSRYLRVLAAQRMTPEEFEKSQENQLLREKTLQLLNQDISVSDAEVEEAYRHQEEKVELASIRLVPSHFEDKVVVDEPSLKEFYERKKEEFRVPEMFSLAYVEFDPADFQAQVTHTPEELEKYYRRHIDRFEIEEQVKIAHIFFRVPDGTDDKGKEKIQQEAGEVLKKIRAGGSFEKLATEYSQDPTSAAKGGEIGYFNRGTMPRALDAAAFSLPINTVSEPLLSPAGYHLIKVLERTESGIRPLEEVKKGAEAGLIAEKAGELAFDKAMDTYNIHRKESKGLEAAAKATGLEIKTTPLFSRGEEAGPLGILPESAEKIFTQEPGQLARPLNLKDKVVLFTVKERQPSRIPELAEIKDKVTKGFRQEKAAELAFQTADSLLAELRQGKTLDEAAAKIKAEVVDTGLFNRRSEPFVPRVGNFSAVFPEVFQLTPEKPFLERVITVEKDAVLVALKKFQPADMTKLTPEERAFLHDLALTQKQRGNISRKLTELNQKAKITIGPRMQTILEES